MLKKVTAVFTAAILAIVLSTVVIASDNSLWTKTYQAEDGSILKIICLSEEEEGNYIVYLDDKVFSNVSYDGLITYLNANEKPMYSSDGKIEFGYGQLYAPIEGGIQIIGNEDGILFESNNGENSDFHLVKRDVNKNSVDSSAVWYEIIKTYKLIETKVTALSASSTVLINGKQVAFEAYNIGGSNYFKLRDLAAAISGSEKQFDVTWDEEKRVINLLSGKEYTAVGGELEKGDGLTKNAILNKSSIYQDGELVCMTAYNINGSNYFKLRDIAMLFNFGVSWNEETNTVIVDTTIEYLKEQESSDVIEFIFE